MSFLKNLEQRTEGSEVQFHYDDVLSRIRCTSANTPSPVLVESRLLSCSFAKKQNHGQILAASCEEGQIILLNTESSKNDSHPYHITHSEENENAIFSVVWSDVDMKLLTTCGDHAVSLWDVHNDLSLTCLDSFKAHRCSVKTACFKPLSSDVFASGGRDGNIYVWDARSYRNGEAEPDQYINNCHKKFRDKKDSSVTCVLFQDDFRLISCADKESNINVWDLRKTYLRSTERPIPVFQLPSPSSRGYSHMILNKNRTKLFANCFSSNIYCYNVSSYSKVPESTYTGHSVGNFFSKLGMSPDDQYIASTDSLNKINLWRVNRPGGPVITLSSQDDRLSGLSDVSWCPEDQLKIATSCDHSAPWIWSVPYSNEEQFSKNSAKTSPVTNSAETGPVGNDPETNPPTYSQYFRNDVPKIKRNRAISTSFKKFLFNQKERSGMILLPNSVCDGFQIHTCNVVEKKLTLTRNWLTNLHNNQIVNAKKQEIKSEIKTPSPKSRKGKSVKRKRCSTSPGNNLTKYFKKTDKNFIHG